MHFIVARTQLYISVIVSNQMKEPEPQPWTAEDKLKDPLFMPSSLQSTPVSPARSCQSKREPSSSCDHGGPMIPPTTLHATKPAVAPGPIAGTSPDAQDGHRSFDHLRAAMESSNVDLFEPLQAALVNLVVVGHSFEVHTRRSTQRMI